MTAVCVRITMMDGIGSSGTMVTKYHMLIRTKNVIEFWKINHIVVPETIEIFEYVLNKSKWPKITRNILYLRMILCYPQHQEKFKWVEIQYSLQLLLVRIKYIFTKSFAPIWVNFLHSVHVYYSLYSQAFSQVPSGIAQMERFVIDLLLLW